MRVLVSVQTGLGNAILKTPALACLAEEMGGVAVDFSGGEEFGASKVFCGWANFGEILPNLDRRDLYSALRHLRLLRKNKYHAVFFPFDSQPFVEIILCMLARCQHIILHKTGHVLPWRYIMLRMISVLTGVKLQLVPLRQNVHETELNLDLVRAFTGKKITSAPASFVEFLADDERFEHQLPLNQRYICLQLSASNGQPTPKVWPLDRFVDLALRLLDFDPEMNIVLLGDSRDLELVGENELLSNPRIFNLLGRTSLFSLAEIVKNARCVVVHDSGIMHLADALKTPLIALYGPTDHTRTRPRGVNSTVIFSDHESRGIMARVELSEPELAELYPDHVCMSDITIEDVFNAIQSKRMKADG